MSTEKVVVTWATDGSTASAVYDEFGRVRITDGERFGWAWLTHAEWEAEPVQVPASEDVRERLEYLRGEIRAERISYGEIAELQDLAASIDPGDVELLEWAGVPEGVDPRSWPRPRNLDEVDRSLDCEVHGHVFGVITGNVRHCVRYGCDARDGYDPDDFVTAGGDLYDLDDPDRDELGYDGDAYVLKLPKGQPR